MSAAHAVRTWVAAAVLGFSCMGLAGCLVIAGSTEKKAAPPTVGQELVDLKTARDNGAVSEVEYERTKAKLLGRVDCHE